MKCFKEAPHAPHGWTFFYVDPPEEHQCPGVPVSPKSEEAR